MNKEQKKIREEELLEFLQFRNRAHKIESKKGKGAKYKRSRDRKIEDKFD